MFKFVKNGAHGGRWLLLRYLNEKKLGSFVNSSQTVPGIHNAAGANAVIEWEIQRKSSSHAGCAACPGCHSSKPRDPVGLSVGVENASFGLRIQNVG